MPLDVDESPRCAPDGSGVMLDEEEGQVKPWDRYFRKPPPQVEPEAIEPGWNVIHDGRRLGDALEAAQAEMVGDLLWGNLALPIDKTLKQLQRIDEICTVPEAERTDKQYREEAALRRECREFLELSTKQLEEMHESKGEFGHEYRVVTAAWYMMMLPDTTLSSHLMAPDDASKVAWDFQEREYERRRVEGQKYRTAREDECLFDEDRARRIPYELVQTKRRFEFTVNIPVPAKTRAADVRVTLKEKLLRVVVNTHPLQPVIDGEPFRPLHKGDEAGCEWHLEGEFESRRLVLDLEKTQFSDWPCLMLSEAPEDVKAQERPTISGANGEVDVYSDDTQVLERPRAEDKFFSWGPPPRPSDGASSLADERPNEWRPQVKWAQGGGLPPLPPGGEASGAEPPIDNSIATAGSASETGSGGAAAVGLTPSQAVAAVITANS
jgi:hypothetical protein